MNEREILHKFPNMKTKWTKTKGIFVKHRKTTKSEKLKIIMIFIADVTFSFSSVKFSRENSVLFSDYLSCLKNLFEVIIAV